MEKRQTTICCVCHFFYKNQLRKDWNCKSTTYYQCEKIRFIAVALPTLDVFGISYAYCTISEKKVGGEISNIGITDTSGVSQGNWAVFDLEYVGGTKGFKTAKKPVLINRDMEDQLTLARLPYIEYHHFQNSCNLV